ncbi:LRR receptor-like serine threonine-protein kinase [Seminavis robusta]|uniref:LRR receptor-like serine threonine-protein kinase n=1 Tax=Seminavis robusta TaxID=568900 RepID=A0A9N8H090_9STRA|nr:LRR receptor-like serine threonine-protein kinase [Seminavis robusta]|eukprot:Sro16_g011940.1 LRR receptor-like serine threonine-protein kinase (1210) ;mRNA; f:166565-170491
MSSSNHGKDKTYGEIEPNGQKEEECNTGDITAGAGNVNGVRTLEAAAGGIEHERSITDENRILSSQVETSSSPSKQHSHVSDGNSPKALTKARPKSPQRSRIPSSATNGNVADDDGGGALDELDIIKIAEARVKGEFLTPSSQANQQVATSNGEAASPRPTVSTLRRGGRRDPPRPHHRIGTTQSANHNNSLEEDSNSVELSKILEARERAQVHQRQQQHTDTSGNNQETRVAISTIAAARDQQNSTLAPGLAGTVSEENQNSSDILKFVRKRATAANQEEKLEEGTTTSLYGNHVGQAITNQSPVTHESQPGAYSGAPGLPPQRNQKARFSQIGIVGTAPISSPSLEGGISQESTEFQSTNLSDRQAGLMVANLVADPSQENLQLAEELQSIAENNIEEQKVERSKRAMLSASKWLLLGVILIVAVVLAVVLGTRNKSATIAQEAVSSAPTTSVMPSVSPSSMPTKTLLSSRYDIKGLSESTAESIGRPGSPQQQAYDWTFQHPEFDEMPNWRKLQLFALGTFYFSFENWPDDYQWMDYSNTECSWTTNLDSPHGDKSSDFIPEGYSNRACETASSASFSRPNPFATNCDEEGHFNYLKLSLFGVHGSIPPEVFLLTHLTIFDVREAGITGTIPSEIGMLSLLTNLNLHSNGISGTIPSGIGQTNLTWLYLHGNAISGFLPSELGLLPFLERMDLQFNDISGTVPADLGICTSLVWVDARNNYLTGLSPEIGLLTSMQYLLLRDNTIKGTIPSEIGLLSNLVYLSLERNFITGTFPSTFDQSSLDQMDLQGNQLSDIPSEIGLLGNQIGQLDLSNNLILTLPSELFLLTSLSVLQLHGNRIEKLPNEIDQMTNLEPCDESIDGWLSLSSNKLSSIPSELGRLTNLRTLTMQDNQISSFPDVNWSHLTNLASIQLSHSLLHSTIPSELGLLQKLVKLDLSNNALIGSIPSELGENEATVYVWNNTLGGNVPQDARLFQTIILRNNQLSGRLPSELFLLTALATLDFSNNSMTGLVMTELGRLTSLQLVDFSFNQISGRIPTEFGQILTTVPEYNFTLNEEVEHVESLQALDLSNNQLSGHLPSELGVLSSLSVLDLSFNQISGPIPTQFGKILTTVQWYDYEQRSIPSELGNLNASVSRIMLSGNNFSGTLPQSLCPWYCTRQQCSVTEYATDTNGSVVVAGDCGTMAGWVEVDCSNESLLDCSVCYCW